ALSGPQDCVVAMADEFERRRRLVVERLGAIADLRTATPTGAFYVFPDVSAFFGRRGPDGPVRTASEVATYLLRHAGVAAVPGDPTPGERPPEGAGRPGAGRDGWRHRGERARAGRERWAGRGRESRSRSRAAKARRGVPEGSVDPRLRLPLTCG